MPMNGDYSDLVTYLIGLFSIKKIPEVAMVPYSIRYVSCVLLRGMSGNREETIEGYPDRDERENVKVINLDVTGIIAPDVICRVSISWDWIKFKPEIDENDATAFVEKLDMSTFRYF